MPETDVRSIDVQDIVGMGECAPWKVAHQNASEYSVKI